MLQHTARDAVNEWQTQARTGIQFMQARIKQHEWLRMVVRAWREEAAGSSTQAAGDGRTAPCATRAAIDNIGQQETNNFHSVPNDIANEQLRKEYTNNMQKRPNRTQQKIKTILTRLRLIEHPAARVNRARKRIRALLEKDLQRRKEEAAKRAREDESIRHGLNRIGGTDHARTPGTRARK